MDSKEFLGKPWVVAESGWHIQVKDSPKEFRFVCCLGFDSPKNIEKAKLIAERIVKLHNEDLEEM